CQGRRAERGHAADAVPAGQISAVGGSARSRAQPRHGVAIPAFTAQLQLSLL
ncbi:hypothetical protein IWW38_001074, partial [Coemansia aciculifera]